VSRNQKFWAIFFWAVFIVFSTNAHGQELVTVDFNNPRWQITLGPWTPGVWHTEVFDLGDYFSSGWGYFNIEGNYPWPNMHWVECCAYNVTLNGMVFSTVNSLWFDCSVGTPQYSYLYGRPLKEIVVKIQVGTGENPAFAALPGTGKFWGYRMENPLIYVSAEPTSFQPGFGSINFTAKTINPRSVDFYVQRSGGLKEYIGSAQSVQSGSEVKAVFVWSGSFPDGHMADPGDYQVFAKTGYYEKNAAFSITSSQIISTNVSPATIRTDKTGFNPGVSFTATTNQSMSVLFKVCDPSGKLYDLGSHNTSYTNGIYTARMDWYGLLPMAGQYTVMFYGSGSEVKTGAFTVQIAETEATGGGDNPTGEKPGIDEPRVEPTLCLTNNSKLPTKSPGYVGGITVGDPVNIVSGNFFSTEVDLILKSRISLSLTRSYNSLERGMGLFGRGWSSNIETKLLFVASDVLFINSDNSRVLFKGENDVFQSPEGVEVKLSLATATGYWTISHPAGSNWVFDENGKILLMTNSCCNGGVNESIVFHYNDANRLIFMTNPAGQRFDFTYNPEGKISQVTDSTGRSFVFSYDTSEQLVAAIDPLGRITEYSYNADGFLSRLKKPGNRVTEITYQDGKVATILTPEDGLSKFTWDETTHKLTLENSVGAVHEYGFNSDWRLNAYSVPEAGITRQFISSGTAVVGIQKNEGQTTLGYDANGLLSSKTDALGNTEVYEYHDTFHRLTKKTDPLGRQWRYVWCPRGNLWSEIDPAGGITSYTYDIHNNRTGKTDPLGRVTRWFYDSSGSNLIKSVDAEGGISSFFYDMRGNIISSSDPLGRTFQFQYDLLDHLTRTIYPDGRFTEIEYDDAGNIALRRDNLGRETRHSYDSAGRLTMLTRPDGTFFSYSYNVLGRKVSETDPLGRITRFEYNTLGLLTKTIYPDGAEEVFTNDTESRLTSRTNELGQTTSLEYDPMGRLLATIDPTGARWESQFDSAGRKIADKDPLGRVTSYELDVLDRVTKVTRPDNSFANNSFDPVGNLLSTVDALGNQWSWVYDNVNRQVKAIQPNGASSTTTFDSAGQVIAETDALNRTTRYSFDNGGRRIATTDALGNVWRNFYDNAGRLTAVQDPMGAVSSMTYDIMDRVISQSDPLGNSNFFEFDAAGRRVAKTDSMGRRSITVFDLRDRVTSEVDPEGHTISNGYNLAGQRVSLTDGANRTWRWEYDSLGRVTTEIDPLGNTNRYSFDSVGNRVSWTNARNQTTNYTFNEMNRLTAIAYPDATTATMSYDLEGRELIRNGASGMVTKTWDSVGNMTSETFGPWGKKWQYSFDLVGNRVQAIDPEGNVFKYRWDALNRMVSLDPPDRGDKITYSFDASGRPIGETRPGVKTTNTFDAAGRLLEMKHERDHGREKVVASRRYQYNAVGNRVSQIDENGEKTLYTFNNSDWLTKAIYPDGKHVTYGYNGAGDRIEEKVETPTVKGHGRNKVIGTDTVVIPLAYDAGGRLVSRASDTFVFDADGNQVSVIENGEESRYFWSPDNRLSKVEKDIECPRHGHKRCKKCPQVLTVSEEYGYLPNDWKRVTRTTKGQTFLSVYSGDDESHEYLLTPKFLTIDWKFGPFCWKPQLPKMFLFREFIGGPGTDDIVSTKYHGRYLTLLKDALGSTIALTNRGGNPVAKIGYDAWGNLRFPDKPGYGIKPCHENDIPDWLDRLDFGRSFGFDFDPHHFGRHFHKELTPYLYTSRRLDSFSGQYFNRNRYYQPKYGRFFSSDPIGFSGDINLFRYGNNNPLLYTDPFGFEVKIVDFGALSVLYYPNRTVKVGREMKFKWEWDSNPKPNSLNGCPQKEKKYGVIQWVNGSTRNSQGTVMEIINGIPVIRDTQGKWEVDKADPKTDVPYFGINTILNDIRPGATWSDSPGIFYPPARLNKTLQPLLPYVFSYRFITTVVDVEEVEKIGGRSALNSYGTGAVQPPVAIDSVTWSFGFTLTDFEAPPR
jgi:RHS repeat-associated protein